MLCSDESECSLTPVQPLPAEQQAAHVNPAHTMSAAAAVPRKASSWLLLKQAGFGFVGGVLLWGAGDVMGEFTTFMKLRDKGIHLANESQELKDQIGHPFSSGPWYNASIGFTAGGSIAQCTFQLKGTQQITDVTVRGLRSAGIANRALYNLLGPGTWTIVDCTAMFPDGGGLVQPKSLLPKTQPSDQLTGQDASSPSSAQPQGSPVPAQESEPSTIPAAAPTQASAKPKSRWWPWGKSQTAAQAGQGPSSDSRSMSTPAT